MADHGVHMVLVTKCIGVQGLQMSAPQQHKVEHLSDACMDSSRVMKTDTSAVGGERPHPWVS